MRRRFGVAGMGNTTTKITMEKGLMGGYLDAMRAYATFEGRISQGDYWRAHIVFGPLIVAAFFWVGPPLLEEPRSVGPALLFLLIIGPHAVPWTALTVRRLHDMDLPGWWALLGLASVPLVPFGVIALLLRCLRVGQPGPNRFGPDPLGRDPMPARGPPAPPMPAQVPPQAAGRPFSPPPPRDVVAELERLAQLRTAGTLSDAEFAVMKAQILNRGRRS